ncbi:dihydrolipoamide acetyltransferase family protein [Rhodoligotrophos defluvii]|uniref:dihydrolipoamide acetyltransferase family protein n=1 Tax=Rhodoligotrophos defluvii TaxID=2561934 RepID=UPI0010C9F7E5|nr:dihydrolipoamide acetyltransferase family protein [Rhodoligotrophos defluvii]
MGLLSIRVPDVGEGVAEAELVEWHVAVGQDVRQDDTLAAVMTDKATVEIPSPAGGKVVKLAAAVGETVAVGAELVRLEVEGEGNVAEEPATAPVEQPKLEASRARGAQQDEAPPVHPPVARSPGAKPLASPAVRLRAIEAGIDLRLVPGSGPAGRITHEDLDAFVSGKSSAQVGRKVPNAEISETIIVGLRRKIAERVSHAYREIPHFAIIEEVDVTALEALRAKLNEEHADDRPKLTVLPFLMLAIVDAVRRQPALNAHYDAEAGVLRQFGGVHIGIATQTEAGLMVPVIRHVETLNLWECAEDVASMSNAAREGKATREALTGSSITISSLGPLGALATTPIINHPEVAIVGVNRMAVRPHWDGTRFVPRKMMNISCSFDHRVVDGWDAAVFVQRLKALLETPALIFVDA